MTSGDTCIFLFLNSVSKVPRLSGYAEFGTGLFQATACYTSLVPENFF